MAATKYRQTANRVLGLVFVLFSIAAAIKYWQPESLAVKLLFTVTEAALVGGIADWFAVTALFRRPLGFPWHTALIPKSRDRVIAAIAGAVQNELLSKESIKRRLADIRLTAVVIAWMEDRDRQAMLPALAARYAQAAWDNLDSRGIARYAQRWLKAALAAADLTGYTRQGLAWALAGGKADELVDGLLAELKAAAASDETRRIIEQQLERYARSTAQSWWQKLVLGLAEATNTLNLAEAATVLRTELIQLLDDLADPRHPIREWMRWRLEAAVERLDGDPEWTASILAWQQGLAGRLRLEEALVSVAELAIANAPADWPAAWAASQAEKLWQAFKNDAAWQSWAEERLKTALGRFIDSEHDLVATVAREALSRLSDEDLNLFIEDKAGEDLAWIRINGSVVGGVVGLLMFLLLHYLYDPYVVPLLHSWFR